MHRSNSDVLGCVFNTLYQIILEMLYPSYNAGNGQTITNLNRLNLH